MSSDPQRRADAGTSGSTSGETTPGCEAASASESAPITIATVLAYLAGNREAILRVSRSRQALWLGFALVVLAGLFREYDQEDLLHEPWHLAIPFAASLGLAGLLLIVLKAIPAVRSCSLPLADEFRRLLTCVWMTAPLAVIYAVPVERMLSAVEATQANLWFLGIVSLWRVILFTRIVSVMYATPFASALFPILLLADSLMIWLMSIIPLPLLQIMGGIQLTESELILNAVRLNLLFFGVVTWLIWLAGTGVIATRRHETAAPCDGLDGPPVSRGMRFACLSAGVLMLLACRNTQPEQQRRYRVEHLLRTGRIDSAVEHLARSTPADFPPYWDPPPRVTPWRMKPDPYQILAACLDRDDVPGWVITAYGEKLVRLRGYGFGRDEYFWMQRSNAELRTLAAFLTRFPEWRDRLDPEFDGGIRCFIDRALEQKLQRRHSKEEYQPEVLLELLEHSSISRQCPPAIKLRQQLETLIAERVKADQARLPTDGE